MENFQPISFVILLLSIKSTPGQLRDHGWLLKSIPALCHCCCFPSPLFLVAGTMSQARRCKSMKYKKKKKRQRKHKAPIIYPFFCPIRFADEKKTHSFIQSTLKRSSQIRMGKGLRHRWPLYMVMLITTTQAKRNILESTA